eukprot:COSAG01_NODE_8442_length_2783_cov_23.918033_3_plen_145_part_00
MRCWWTLLLDGCVPAMWGCGVAYLLLCRFTAPKLYPTGPFHGLSTRCTKTSPVQVCISHSCSGGTLCQAVVPSPFCPALLRPHYCCLSTLILDLHCFLHDTALLVIDLQNYMCNPGEWDQSALGASCMHSQGAAACRGLLQRWA